MAKAKKKMKENKTVNEANFLVARLFASRTTESGQFEIVFVFCAKKRRTIFGLTVDHKKVTYFIWKMINGKLPKFVPKQISYLS